MVVVVVVSPDCVHSNGVVFFSFREDVLTVIFRYALINPFAMTVPNPMALPQCGVVCADSVYDYALSLDSVVTLPCSGATLLSLLPQSTALALFAIRNAILALFFSGHTAALR